MMHEYENINPTKYFLPICIAGVLKSIQSYRRTERQTSTSSPSKFTQNTDRSIPASLKKSKETSLLPFLVECVEASKFDSFGQMGGSVNAIDKLTQKEATIAMAICIIFQFDSFEFLRTK